MGHESQVGHLWVTDKSQVGHRLGFRWVIDELCMDDTLLWECPKSNLNTTKKKKKKRNGPKITKKFFDKGDSSLISQYNLRGAWDTSIPL